MIVIIDNYDSFVYNLYQYVGEFTKEVLVFRNDEITVEEIRKLNPKGIIISPGPGRPEDSKVSLNVIRELGGEVPILGVCLGHQGIALVSGAIVEKNREIVHGKKSKLIFKDNEIFYGINKEFQVMRYHSLVVKKESINEDLEVLGTLEDGTIMAIKVKKKKLYGLQFHPESIGTNYGKQIIENFLRRICNEY